jgi:hypothetical protein
MPLYEYCCPHHGVFEVLHRTMPTRVPREAACPVDAQRAAPEGSQMAKCYAVSALVPSLGFYGEAQAGTLGRLSRAQRRYHSNAPEREARERKERATRRKTPITRAELRERAARGGRG